MPIRNAISGSRLSSKVRNSAAEAATKLIWMPDSRPTMAVSAKRPAISTSATKSAPAMSLNRWNAGAISVVSISTRFRITASL